MSAAGHAQPRPAGPSAAGLRAAGERIALGLVPLLVVAGMLLYLQSAHGFVAVDVHGWFWPAGRRVLDGLSVYARPPLEALNYPAPAALLLAPFGLLPRAAADWVLTAAALAAVPATLRLAGVRDWRVLGVALLWQPVAVGWETGNLSLVLLAGLAAAWRLRGRPVAAGVILGLVVAVKPLLAPLLLWPLLTRRPRLLLCALGLAAAASLAGWAVLGFDQIPVYLRVLTGFATLADHWGYGLVSLLLDLGASRPVADLVGVVAAAGLVVVSVRAARGPDRDRAVFSSLVIATLVASPVVEAHYLSLLVLPLAISRSRLSVAWFVPTVLWAAPADHPGIAPHVLVLAAMAIIAAAALRPSRARRSRPAPPGAMPAVTAWRVPAG